MAQRVGEREDMGLREGEEEAEAAEEPLRVTLGHWDAEKGAVPVSMGLPEVRAEEEATESCEGLCAGVEVVQRVGERVEEEL